MRGKTPQRKVRQGDKHTSEKERKEKETATGESEEKKGKQNDTEVKWRKE